jgi:hypothetical protein
VFEPVAGEGCKVVVKAGGTGFIVDETNRVELRAASGTDRAFDL